jgi:hypothetical protein
VCTRCLRFNQPWLNDFFVISVLALPFLALRPVSHLPKIPKIIGRILLAPVLLLSLVLALVLVSELELPGPPRCQQDAARLDQEGYSVHLVGDYCGGPTVGFALFIEQRMPLLPGLYLVRSVDVFDDASDGNLSAVGPDQIRVQIPRCVDGNGRHEQIDHVYQLKPHVYF